MDGIESVHEVGGWRILAIFPMWYSHNNGGYAYVCAARTVDLQPVTRLYVVARVNDLTDSPEEWREVTTHVSEEAGIARALVNAGWSGVARALDAIS